MNQERNLRQVPARELYICCIHGGEKTQNSEACKVYPKYEKEIYPCCMHKCEKQKFLTCLHLYLFYALLIFNAFQIFMFLLPTKITILCAIVCIVYWQSAHFNPLDKTNCLIISAVCGVDILAEILMAFVPRVLVCQQLIFLGAVGLFWMRGIVRRKAKYTIEKTNRLDISIKKQQVITINKKHLKNEVQKCCICWTKNSNYIVLPCMHKNYCEQCVNRIDNCSLCRKPISEKINYSDSPL